MRWPVAMPIPGVIPRWGISWSQARCRTRRPKLAGVNENDDDMVIIDSFWVNSGANPVVGQQNVPVLINLTSLVMDDFNEQNGDDVLWNVSITANPVVEYWDGAAWIVTNDITISEEYDPAVWIDEAGPTNALWTNRDDEANKLVPWFMDQAWDDHDMDFIDEDNDGILEQETDTDENELRNITGGSKTALFMNVQTRLEGSSTPSTFFSLSYATLCRPAVSQPPRPLGIRSTDPPSRNARIRSRGVI